MFIQTEETPNPQTLKFLPESLVLGSGVNSLEFKKGDETSTCPIAKRLLSIDGVEGVFLNNEYISITKHQDFDWYVLKPAILGLLMEHFINNLPIYNGSVSVEFDESDPIIKQIREIIDTRVRPSVAMDGGDIIYKGFKEGVVYLQLHGACSGCPSSTVTLKNGIESMLQHYIPEVQGVEALEE